MKIEKQILQDIIELSEQLPDGYDKPGSQIKGRDLEKFAAAFKGLGAQLRLKKKIRVVDVVKFCDALQNVVVLE